MPASHLHHPSQVAEVGGAADELPLEVADVEAELLKAYHTGTNDLST